MPAGDDPAPPGGKRPTLRDLGERGFIERMRRSRPAAGADVLLGIGDDAAAVAWGGLTLLLTTDTLVEDVHFRRATSPFHDIGAKALAVNLSDIAAMGGEPRYALLAMALPSATAVADADAILAGLDEMATRHGVVLIGGDTCQTPDRIVLTITLAGAIAGAPLGRRGARPGDVILVTGTLGAAAAGLAVLARPPGAVPADLVASVVRAHRRPTPRVAEGRLIHASGAATAMIDLSDGLASDLDHLARESGVGADVRLSLLPIGDATRAVAAALGADAADWAVSGGEDYELLFTAVPEEADRLAAQVTGETGTTVHVIGRIEPSAGIRFRDMAGSARPARPGFEHFA